MKELAEEIEGQFTFSGENTEKYKTFSVPIEKQITRIDKKWKEVTKTISYRLQIIGSARFIATSLSNFVNSLAEGIHKIKCKYRQNKKYETYGIRYRDCDCFLECSKFKDNLREYNCLCCKKIIRNSLMKT